jgi:hypothetical protein
MPYANGHEDYCYQGSTGFYDEPSNDEFTPSYLEAGLLSENLVTRRDGTIPPWIIPGSTKQPAQQFVEWFNYIWHTGDPSSWNETVFTNQAVMMDPSGVSKGAKQAAASFLALFKYYPDLRGEVVSWAANDREIMINWRFEIRGEDNERRLVSVVDKFCFLDARVSFRLAYFDVLTLIGYLSETYGQNQLVDFLMETFWRAQKTGGVQLLPRSLWNAFKGAFLWVPAPEPTGLLAVPGDGSVKLTWAYVKSALSYRLTRATDISGPYQTIEAEIDGLEYEDISVKNGTAYWYLIAPNFAKDWPPCTPVVRHAGTRRSAAQHRRAVRAGSTVE